KQRRLDLYSTSLARFITVNTKLPFQVKLLPGKPGLKQGGLHPDERGKSARLKSVPKGCDGRGYTFYLGPPIISCSVDDLNKKNGARKYQRRLRKLLRTERLNTVYRVLGLPYWNWVLGVETNKSHRLGYAYDEDRVIQGRKALLEEIVPFVCALGLSY